MSRGATLRIGGGFLRGRKVVVPDGARPSGSRLREALFSIWRERLEEARFLDLFAGSGAVGIEAVSRGAQEVAAVEFFPRSLSILRRNLGALVPEQGRAVRLRLPGNLAGLGRFDLIFADPPYAFRGHEALLLSGAGCATPTTELALEHSSRTETPERAGPWQRHRTRNYGESCLSFYRIE